MIRLLLIVAGVLLLLLAVKTVSAGPGDADMRAVAHTDDGVRDLIRMKKKIAAIRLYREIHSVGLKEAKEAVESMARDMT